jgi:hypothetical protein
MDPYLEPHWLDVHTKLVAYAADDLNAQMPDALFARTEERVAVESGADEPHRLAPDVRVLEAVERDVVARAGHRRRGDLRALPPRRPRGTDHRAIHRGDRAGHEPAGHRHRVRQPDEQARRGPAGVSERAGRAADGGRAFRRSRPRADR